MFLNNDIFRQVLLFVFKNTPTIFSQIMLVYKCLRTDPGREVFSNYPSLNQADSSRVLKETAPSGLSTKSKEKKSWYSQTVHLTVSAKIQGSISSAL